VADVAIHLIPIPARPARDTIDPARWALRGQARRPLADVFFRRCAERTLRWTACAYPRACEDESILIRAMFLDQPDPAAAWREQERRQAELIAVLAEARELRFVTPAGTNLRLGVAGPPWRNSAGHDNLPDGEVNVAPLEDASEGTVVFDVPRT